MDKQVFDLRPGVGMSAGQSTEHLRNYSTMDPDAKIYGYYDPTRVKLNFEVGRGGVIIPVRKNYSIVQRFKDNLRNRNMEDPNIKKRQKGLEPNRKTIVNIILGGSHNRMHQIAYGKQQVNLERGADNSHITRNEDIEKWAKDMYDFVSTQFGEENIVAFIVHLDEKNPHIHCTLVPVNKKGKISYNDILGGNKESGRKKLKILHDKFAEVNKKWGLERGTDISLTGAKHRTSEEYWRWLKNTCEDLEEEKTKTEGELAGKKAALNFIKKEIFRANIKMKGLSKMVENLDRDRTDILNEIVALDEEMKKGKINSQELERRSEELKNKLSEIEAKLQDKQEKLKEAVQQLDDLAGRRVALQRDYDNLKRAINKDLPKLQDKRVRDMSATAWDIAAEETKEICRNIANYAHSLSPSERNVFDNMYHAIFKDSIVEDMARAGNEIAAMAAALSLGYVEQATTFAQAHSGGGGSPSEDWGRGPNDDDEKWLRKCFHMARMMMRPPGRTIQKNQSRGVHF